LAIASDAETILGCSRSSARELGVSQAQLSRYEKGRSGIGAEVLLRISRKFGKSMKRVLTGEDK
jgi:transcriptional regulator with XRE-family HTH domain